jgi:hypothetical protein
MLLQAWLDNETSLERATKATGPAAMLSPAHHFNDCFRGRDLSLVTVPGSTRFSYRMDLLHKFGG